MHIEVRRSRHRKVRQDHHAGRRFGQIGYDDLVRIHALSRRLPLLRLPERIPIPPQKASTGEIKRQRNLKSRRHVRIAGEIIPKHALEVLRTPLKRRGNAFHRAHAVCGHALLDDSGTQGVAQLIVPAGHGRHAFGQSKILRHAV